MPLRCPRAFCLGQKHTCHAKLIYPSLTYTPAPPPLPAPQVILKHSWECLKVDSNLRSFGFRAQHVRSVVSSVPSVLAINCQWTLPEKLLSLQRMFGLSRPRQPLLLTSSIERTQEQLRALLQACQRVAMTGLPVLRSRPARRCGAARSCSPGSSSRAASTAQRGLGTGREGGRRSEGGGERGRGGRVQFLVTASTDWGDVGEGNGQNHCDAERQCLKCYGQ